MNKQPFETMPDVMDFDEASDMIEVQTHNTDLKRRLRDFTQKHPKCCRHTDNTVSHTASIRLCVRPIILLHIRNT